MLRTIHWHFHKDTKTDCTGDPDMGPRWASKMFENLPKWIHQGSFKAQMSVTDGMDNAATGFVGMLKGENFGKAVLKIAELDEKVC